MPSSDEWKPLPVRWRMVNDEFYTQKKWREKNMKREKERERKKMAENWMGDGRHYNKRNTFRRWHWWKSLQFRFYDDKNEYEQIGKYYLLKNQHTYLGSGPWALIALQWLYAIQSDV